MARNPASNPHGPSKETKGRKFVEQTIPLDDRRFVNCVFEQCTFQFIGKAPFEFVDCQIDDCGWRFDEAAGLTIGILSRMYHQGFDRQVEDLFDKIRGDS